MCAAAGNIAGEKENFVERMTQSAASVASLSDILPMPPRAVMNADQEKMATRIERLIRRQTNDKVRDLRVLVLDEGVTLKGRCGTFYSKQLAQHAAMELSESPILANDIEVR